MALLPRIPITSFNNKFNIVGHFQFVLSKSTQIDVIDAFTKNLMQNKTLKWQIFYTKLNKLESEADYSDSISNETKTTQRKLNSVNSSLEVIRKQSPSSGRLKSKLQINNLLQTIQRSCIDNDITNIDIRKLDRSQLDELLESVLHSNEKYLNYVLNECIKWKLLPSTKVIECYLKELCLKGDTKCVDDIIRICDNCKENNELNSRKLSTFKGISLWKSGKTEKALDTLINGFTSHTQQQQLKDQPREHELVHWAFREIIKDTLTTKSEAVLIRLIKFGNLIYARYNDIYIISWIWKRCFASDWYSDQKLAMEIFLNNEKLRNLVFNRSASLCFTFLRENAVDSVYRLIELCLKFDRKDACKNCLDQLFLYQYWRKNFRACSEILKTSKELNIPLNENYSLKLLDIILNRSNGNYTLKTPTIKRFEYKF